MSFRYVLTLNVVDLCVGTIKSSNKTHAKEVCKALEDHERTAKVRKGHCTSGNYVQKYQISRVHVVYTAVDWPKNSEKYDLYINEEEKYEF